MDALWLEHLDALARALRTLRDGEFLLIESSLIGDAYVQYAHHQGMLFAECSGALIDGGPADLSTSQQAAILEMGWYAPDFESDAFPNYRILWQCPQTATHDFTCSSGDAALYAAADGIQTLRGPLGVRDPRTVRTHRQLA